MEIPGGRGEQPEALWNGKSGGVGAQTVNNPPWGGVWIFSGTTQFKFIHHSRVEIGLTYFHSINRMIR